MDKNTTIINDELEVKILEVDKKEIILKIKKLWWTKILDDITEIETIDFEEDSCKLLSTEWIEQRYLPIIEAINKITKWKTTLSKKWAYLRIRKEWIKTELILKFGIKTRLEVKAEKEISFNFDYSEWENVRDYLKILGLWYSFFTEKQRISYILNAWDVRIDIDTWPQMPTYIEIEWKKIENIFKVVKILWYSKDDVTSVNASKLFKKYWINQTNLRFEK